MAHGSELDLTVVDVYGEIRRTPNNTARIIGNSALTLGLFSAIGALSYIAYDSIKFAQETSLAYPTINAQLQEWDFDQISELTVNVSDKQFNFTTLLTKIPEDSDVVGQLVPTNCTGTYEYVAGEIMVDPDMICEDNGTIPYVLGGFEDI